MHWKVDVDQIKCNPLEPYVPVRVIFLSCRHVESQNPYGQGKPSSMMDFPDHVVLDRCRYLVTQLPFSAGGCSRALKERVSYVTTIITHDNEKLKIHVIVGVILPTMN